MRNHKPVVRGMLLVLVLAQPLPGCAAVAVGAAGAGAGIALTSQGASSLVQGSMVEVDLRTRAVLRELGVEVIKQEAEQEASGREVEIRGVVGNRHVGVELKYATPTTTQLHVSVRQGTLEWDRDYARDVVQRVVASR